MKDGVFHLFLIWIRISTLHCHISFSTREPVQYNKRLEQNRNLLYALSYSVPLSRRPANLLEVSVVRSRGEQFLFLLAYMLVSGRSRRGSPGSNYCLPPTVG